MAPAVDAIADLECWTPAERDALASIVRAKAGKDERGFLRRMQKHRRLRDDACEADGNEPRKVRAVVLGNPRLADTTAPALGAKKAEADRFAENIAPMIREIKKSGITSLRGIALPAH